MQALNAISGLTIPILTYITTIVYCYISRVKPEDTLAFGLWCTGLFLSLVGCCWLFSLSGQALAKRDPELAALPGGFAPTVLEAFIMQTICVLLFALTLDRGVLLQACLYADLGYWAGVVIIYLRRRHRLTRTDYLFLRWGWLPILIFGTTGFYLCWEWKRVI